MSETSDPHEHNKSEQIRTKSAFARALGFERCEGVSPQSPDQEFIKPLGDKYLFLLMQDVGLTTSGPRRERIALGLIDTPNDYPRRWIYLSHQPECADLLDSGEFNKSLLRTGGYARVAAYIRDLELSGSLDSPDAFTNY